jgi:hypothetical protein
VEKSTSHERKLNSRFAQLNIRLVRELLNSTLLLNLQANKFAAFKHINIPSGSDSCSQLPSQWP